MKNQVGPHAHIGRGYNNHILSDYLIGEGYNNHILSNYLIGLVVCDQNFVKKIKASV